MLLLLSMPFVLAQDVCEEPGPVSGLQEGLEATPAPVYYGTLRPKVVPMENGEILAIGTFGNCSGTLITGKWVATADHCNLRKGARFCIGNDAGDPDTCYTAVRVVDNRNVDLTLVELERDATEDFPDLKPIGLVTADLGSDHIGKKIEAAGYGSQEDGGYGEREFAQEEITRIGSKEVTIYGDGDQGVCFGDSGGPLLIEEDGKTHIAGVLSWGDNSCLGYDHYTRLDTMRDWIVGYTGEEALGKPADKVEEVDPEEEPAVEEPAVVDVDPEEEPIEENPVEEEPVIDEPEEEEPEPEVYNPRPRRPWFRPWWRR